MDILGEIVISQVEKIVATFEPKPCALVNTGESRSRASAVSTLALSELAFRMSE